MEDKKDKQIKPTLFNSTLMLMVCIGLLYLGYRTLTNPAESSKYILGGYLPIILGLFLTIIGLYSYTQIRKYKLEDDLTTWETIEGLYVAFAHTVPVQNFVIE